MTENFLKEILEIDSDLVLSGEGIDNDVKSKTPDSSTVPSELQQDKNFTTKSKSLHEILMEEYGCFFGPIKREGSQTTTFDTNTGRLSFEGFFTVHNVTKYARISWNLVPEVRNFGEIMKGKLGDYDIVYYYRRID